MGHLRFEICSEVCISIFKIGSSNRRKFAECRSRREISNEALLGKFGVDTARTSPLEFGLPPCPPDPPDGVK